MRTRNILYYTAVTVYYSKYAILVITVIWCIMTHASRARGSGGGALTETLDRAAARSRPEPAETGARKQSETRETSGRRRTRHAGSKQEQGTIRRECEQTTWTREELTDGWKTKMKCIELRMNMESSIMQWETKYKMKERTERKEGESKRARLLKKRIMNI